MAVLVGTLGQWVSTPAGYLVELAIQGCANCHIMGDIHSRNVTVHISFYLMDTTTISHTDLVCLLQVNRGGSEGIKEEDSIICEQFSV